MYLFFRRSRVLLLGVLLCLTILSCNGESSNSIGLISQTELISQIQTQKPILILDVRTEKEYKQGHIPTAVNIDFRKLKERINEIEKYKSSTVIVYCEGGIRAKVAEATLQKAGFQQIFHLEGNMSAWRKNSLPIILP